MPALSHLWSGIFQLRAQGGFLVASDVSRGAPHLVEIRSLLGNRCRIENPWDGQCNVVKDQQIILSTADETVEFDTSAAGIYVLESADKPLGTFTVTRLEERFSEARGYAAHGLPGRND